MIIKTTKYYNKKDTQNAELFIYNPTFKKMLAKFQNIITNLFKSMTFVFVLIH